VDAQGRVHPEAGHEIAFDLQGEAHLIGLDNGDMSNQEDFKGKRRKVFHGLGLAILQSTANAGPIRLTATSPGLEPATVTITSRA
jgi:beta-galactosidase